MSRLVTFFVCLILFLSTVSASSLDFDSSLELEAWPQPEAVEAPMADLLLKHQEHMFANTLTGGVDPCVSYNPCQNNGTCFTLSTVGAGMYTCYCTDGWQGTNCTIATANATLLVFESPFDGLYTGVQGQLAPISLNGTKLIQGGVDAGNIVRLNLRSLARNTNIFVNDPFNASVTRYLGFNTTVTIDTTISVVNSLLNSLFVRDSDVPSAVAFPILYIEAVEFNGTVSTGLGTALRSANITLSLKLVPGSTGYQGITLLSITNAVAVIENTPISFGDIGFDIEDFDIVNNLKVDSVSVRVTAVNGSIAYQTGYPAQYYGFIFSTGRLADMRTYLKNALYRANTGFTQDTLTFILSDSLNTSTYVVPVSVSLLNRPPVVTPVSTAVLSIFDDQAITLPGWTVTDVDSTATSQFTAVATAVRGQLNLVNSTDPNTPSIGGVSSLSDLNTILKNIRYFPTYGAIGRDNITVCVTDDGANLPGGAQSNCSTISINVNLRIIAPLAPVTPTVASYNATWAFLRWGPALTADPHYGNSSRYSYELQILRYTNASTLSYGTVFNGTGTSFNITGLVPNSLYLFQLRAFNGAGASLYTAQTITNPDNFTGDASTCAGGICSGFRTDLTAPTIIVPAAVVLDASSVRLTWNPPADNGGVPLTSYIVYWRAQNYRPEGNGAIVTGVCTLNTTSCTGSAIVSPSTLTFTVTGLQALMPYWFAVSAVNAVGYASEVSLINGIFRTGVTTLANAPALVSFTVVDTIGANTATYHVGNAFRFAFDVATTTPSIFNSSLITYSQPVGTLSYSWISATVLQATVTSLPGGAAPQIGVLTATFSGLTNIQRASAASIPFAGTTGPVTGVFGVISSAPTISNIGFNATGYPTGVPILFRFNVIALPNDNNIYNLTVATSNPAGSTVRYIPLSNNYTIPATAGVASQSTVNGLSTINFYGTAQFLTLFANNGLYYTGGGFSAATGSVVVTISTSTNVVLASASANIRLLSTNAPPSLTVSSRNTTLPVGSPAPLGLVFTVTDLDAANFPANPVRASLQIVIGSISVSTNASVVSTSAGRVVTITGTFADVVAALNTLVITNDIPSSNNGVNTLLVTFDDLNNGNYVPGTTIRPGLTSSATIALFSDCAASVNNNFAASGMLFDNLGGFYIPLDGYIGPGVLASNTFDCANVIASTASLGVGAECGIVTADNPLAATVQASILYVKFGTGATLSVNDTVVAVPGSQELRRCRTATPTSQLSSAVIGAPMNVVVPSFTLQGPTTLSFCPGSSAVYSVLPISGFGGRDIASYSWSATGLNSSTNPSFLLSSDAVNTGSNITLSVTVSNWAGGRFTRTIIVARANVPAVTLTGPSQRSVSRDTTFLLDFVVSLPTCLNTSVPAVSHQWIVSPSTGLDAATSSSPSLRVLANTLAFNTVYTYTLISRLNGSSTTTSASVVVSVADRPLVARIDGGSYRTVATNAINTFLTTTSSIPIASPSVTYAWSCLDNFGFACVDATSNAVFPVYTTSSVAIGANTQAPGVYYWTVKLTANNGATSSFTTTVQVTAATASPVPVRLSFSPSVLNVDTVLRITPALPLANSNYNFQWSISNGVLPTLTATQRSSPVLVLNQAGDFYFTAGTAYTFRLRVSAKSDPVNTVSIAEISLVCNNPPSGGSLSLTPATGSAALTSFRFTSPNWKDLDNNEPLTYQYFFLNADGAGVWISGPTIQPVWDSALPAGATVTNNQLTVGVVITDTAGGKSFATTTATVTVPSVIPTSGEIIQSNYYTIANASTEANKIVAAASVTGVLLNTLTPASEDQSALRLPLLNQITPLLPQTPVSLSLQAITNLVGSTHTPSRAMLQKAVDMLNTLLTLTGNDASAAEDRADILSYQQLYQNMLSQ